MRAMVVGDLMLVSSPVGLCETTCAPTLLAAARANNVLRNQRSIPTAQLDATACENTARTLLGRWAHLVRIRPAK